MPGSRYLSGTDASRTLQILQDTVMVGNVIVPLALLSAAYGLVIAGSVLLLRRARPLRQWAIVLGFLIFGATAGILIAWAWPLDSSVYFNVFAVLLGDWVYDLSSRYLGDPWVLRVPHVYVVTSTALCGLVSLPVQWLHNAGQKRGKESQGRRRG